MSDLIGKSLGRYHILEQLGEGGMATVYKAYDTRLEADVAVKVIRTENISPSLLERSLKRFEREAKALARLNHPNIVRVTDYGEYEGKPYLVMPYFPGGTLKQKLGKPIPWQDAIQILLPIAEALDYAHSQNMIHRDVKPSNILLTDRGQPMLTDFGIAKILDLEDTQDLTGTSAAIGTPEYMAPEQATSKTVDYRADIYSLGIVLYEMVTGRRPFTADTPMAVLIKHVHDPFPSPKKHVPNLPDKVEKTLLKTLAKQPENRYQAMDEFATALKELLTGIPASKLVSTPDTLQQVYRETTIVEEVRSESPTSVDAPYRMFSSLPFWIGLVVVCALGLFGMLLGGRKILSAIFPTSMPSPTARSTQTQIPRPSEVIGIDNISRLSILNSWSNPAGRSTGRILAFSPNSEILASASETGIDLWNVPAGNLITSLSATGVTTLDYSPVDNIIAAGYEDRSVKIWDVSQNKIIKTLTNGTDYVSALSFSPDGKFLATTSHGLIYIWNVETGDLINTFDNNDQEYVWPVTGLVYSTDGSRLISVSNEWLHIWSIPDGKILMATNVQYLSTCLGEIGHMSSTGFRAAFSPMEDLYAFACDKILIGNGLSADITPLDQVYCKTDDTFNTIGLSSPLLFSRNGELLISGGAHLWIWDIQNSSFSLIIDPCSSPFSDRVQDMALSPDGTMLAVGITEITLFGIP